jgi:hypothetical protein
LFDLDEVELPPPTSVSASTQVRTDETRRVDLQVLGVDGSGSISGRLWAENKTGAGYQPDQLLSYRRSLAKIPGRSQVITIVPRKADAVPEAESVGVPILTWQRVAEIAWSSARNHEQDPQWRISARRAATSAGLRLLEELISYLEEDHAVTLDPVRFEHIQAFQLANETSEALVELLARTADLARDLDVRGDVGYDVRNDWGNY